MNDHLSALPPSLADCTIARACAHARGQLRRAIANTRKGDGDFWFASEQRLRAIEEELAEMEKLFVDLYGRKAWAALAEQELLGGANP